MSSDSLQLISVVEATRTFAVQSNGVDVLAWPDEVNGWTDVLDCRHEPFASRTIEENTRFADGCRKLYILVAPS